MPLSINQVSDGHNCFLFPFGTRSGKALWSEWQDLHSHSISITALNGNQQINSDMSHRGLINWIGFLVVI